MFRYVLNRIWQAIICMFVVVLVIFWLGRLMGDPVTLFVDDYSTAEEIAIMKTEMGLDEPIPVQFLVYLKDVFRGNLGESLYFYRPVTEVILQRFPATLQLGGLASIVAVIIGLPLGIYAAVNRGRWSDTLARVFAVLGQSAPTFWLGLVLIFIFAVTLNILPSGGRGGPQYLILPAVTLGVFVSAGIMRITRSSMLETLNTEYVKFARIKGVPEWLVIWKHALKNALLPILTFSIILFVLALSGSVVTETVFAWPGVGRLIYQSIRARDYPVVQGAVLLLSLMYISANFLVDILYGYLNPKIRFGVPGS
ncbi:ABC transporter permease [Chloroflexota bacterium]